MRTWRQSTRNRSAWSRHYI